MRSSGWVVLGLACSLLAYLLLAAPLFDTPLRGDETIWPAAAAPIAESGLPEQRFDEMSLVTHPGSFVRRYPVDWGAGHPPAYLYLLAVPTAVLGDATAGRLVAIGCALVTLTLVFFAALGIVRRLGFRDRAAALTAAGAALALGTSPYWVSYSLYLDIDTSLYPLAGMCVLFLVSRRPRARRLLPLTLLLAGLHWVKLTAFGFTAGGMLLHWALARRFSLVVGTALAALLGTTLFAFSWLVFAAVSESPALGLVEYLSADKGGTQSIRSLFEVLNTLRGFVAGAGFPLALLVVVGAVRYAQRVLRRQVEDHDVYFVVGALTVLTYTLLFPYAGKYVVPAMPVLALHGAVESARVVREKSFLFETRRLVVTGACGSAIFAFQLFAVGDMITGPEFRAAATKNLAGAFDDPRLVRYVLALVPLAALALVARLVLKLDAIRSLAVAALVAVVPANAGESIATLPNQATSVLPVRERGYEDVVRWFDRVPPGTRVVAEADLAFHVPDLRVIPEERNYYYPADQLTEALPSSKYVVVAKGREPSDAGFDSVLRRDFRVAATRGSFTIWQRR
jgi:hypothetical protein